MKRQQDVAGQQATREMPCRVRPAGPSDAVAIAAAHYAAWQAAYQGLLPAGFLTSMTLARFEDRWRERLESGVFSVLACEQAGGVVGMVAFGPSRDDDAGTRTGEVYAIYLAPQAWGQGCGRQLMDMALGRLREGGHDEVTLWVLRGNHRARRFYERAGFRVDGAEKREKRGEDVVFDEVRYRRVL